MMTCYVQQEEYPKYQMINVNHSIAGLNAEEMISDLNASYLNTVIDLSYTNEMLFELYKMHEWIIGHHGIYEDGIIRIRSYFLMKNSKAIKTIVHDIKRATDQLIATISLLSHTHNYIESVGSLFKYREKETEFLNYFSEHMIFLKLLNNMDNSFKHHLTNDIKRYFDSEKPVITVFYCKDYSKGYGDNKREKVIEKPMDEFINEFNEFLSLSKSILMELLSV